MNYITRTYDPGQVDINADGVDVSGYAKGQFVKVQRNADQAALSVGADGESTVSLSQNRSGRVIVTLQQTSPLNDIFDAHAEALEARTGGFFPLMVKDGNGTFLANTKKAWIVKRPDSEFADEAGNREWIFESGNMFIKVGGNNEIG